MDTTTEEHYATPPVPTCDRCGKAEAVALVWESLWLCKSCLPTTDEL